MELTDIKKEVFKVGKKYDKFLTYVLIDRLENPPCKFNYSDKKLLKNTFKKIDDTFKLVIKNLNRLNEYDLRKSEYQKKYNI